ncbi:serine/threonine protein kinase [Streptomyces indicus]|uniref:Serine/threonine protein kinase n=1 Tax=Streptomyces indicus TaxID=417292 RepID=A0A1G9CED7_9ACTN|nr:serine/threonine-protein kinase [Streptomyces indicus]SDK50019.1 Serine/threonine protein kinase [Streptomyces indicus]
MDGLEPLTPDEPARIGPYTLIGRLGSGGMGRVYLARAGAGRAVAVKLVHSELAGQSEFRERFAREVTAARRVTGEWTAPVIDADTDAAVPWVATGYIPGMSLQALVAREFGPLPEDSLRVLANRLAQALRAVHDAGLVHRDLKPSNILVTAEGPRVIDFGVARALDTVTGGQLTQTGAVLGSPGFMSPEQVRGERLTPASDVFSLGCALVFAATGRGPFEGADSGAHALMFRVAFEEPDLAGVPEGILDLVRECLRKEPGERPDAERLLELTNPDPLGPWLPEPVLTLLAGHASALLAAEVTRLPAEPSATGGTQGPATAGRKRRPKLIATGAVLAVCAAASLAYVLNPAGDEGGRTDAKGATGGAGRSSQSPGGSGSPSPMPSESKGKGKGKGEEDGKGKESPGASASSGGGASGGGDGKVASAFVGGWEGELPGGNGILRIDIRAGREGDTVATSVDVGNDWMCVRKSVAVSADSSTLELNGGEFPLQRNPAKCTFPTEMSLTAGSADVLNLKSSEGTVRLSRAGTAVPSSYVGKWQALDLEGNRNKIWFTIEAGAVGTARITVVDQRYGTPCTTTQVLASLDKGLVYGPSSKPSGGDCGARTSERVTPYAGGKLLVEDWRGPGSEPAELVRAQ